MTAFELLRALCSAFGKVCVLLVLLLLDEAGLEWARSRLLWGPS